MNDDDDDLLIYIPLQTRLTTGKYSSHVKMWSPRGVVLKSQKIDSQRCKVDFMVTSVKVIHPKGLHGWSEEMNTVHAGHRPPPAAPPPSTTRSALPNPDANDLSQMRRQARRGVQDTRVTGYCFLA